VLIATPGRLLDLFERGKILMNDVKILVIDEADRMLDMGFIPDVERIVSLLSKIRQTLFFSATMAPEVRRLADAFLMNPKEITVSPPATTATNVTQGLIVVDEMDKREALRRLIRSETVTNALVFCNRKKDVDILYRSLTKHGFDAVQLHGDMAQSKRTETLEKFKGGEVSLMVCSDVAARGIDIKGLSHVFNFDVAHHAEDYVHRIGRTGRAGREGRAYTFATPDDGKAVEAIEKLIGKEIPRIQIEGIETQPFSEGDSRRRGRGRGRKSASDRSGTEPASGGRGRGRGRSRGGSARDSQNRDSQNRDTQNETAVAEEAIVAAIPHPAPAPHRHETLEAGTALPEIASEIVPTHAAEQGQPDASGQDSNRHGRRAAAHGDSDQGRGRNRRRHGNRDEQDDHSPHPTASGPFGDHTPEFFARELRRQQQIERRLVK
ncbi:MAG TPA: DEAD/DEAH box helicase, partial [Dongiaceae bacterium]